MSSKVITSRFDETEKDILGNPRKANMKRFFGASFAETCRGVAFRGGAVRNSARLCTDSWEAWRDEFQELERTDGAEDKKARAPIF